MNWKRLAPLVALTSLSGLCSVAPIGTPQLEILIPAYFYPTHWNPGTYLWDDLAVGRSQVPITAIVNASNGPGVGGPNADYIVGTGDLAAAAVSMVGYVYTDYGARDAATVRAEIDEWAVNWSGHGVNGIFLDEASTDPADITYYEHLYDYALAKPEIERVIINPGITTDELYLSLPAADVVVDFESTYAAWSIHTPGTYAPNYPDRLAMLVHATADTVQMENAIDLAIARGTKYVYVTDDTIPPDGNPWDTLPAFWQAELDYIEAANASAAVPALPLGALLVFLGGVSGAAVVLLFFRRDSPRANSSRWAQTA